ncbi:hypothetical protein [Kitasatospora sp. NPDC088548]|uniref:hypothetical protein n=1 Tax=Kitasatospora sp. NPDC088548 TaxID=3364075 RepID=UPI0038103BFA
MLFPDELRDAAHRGATFYPHQPGDADGPPAGEVVGVMVHFYLHREDGHVRISIDTDQADPDLFGPDADAPVHITLNGQTVHCTTATDDGREWGVAGPDGRIGNLSRWPSRAAADNTARTRGTLLVVRDEGSQQWFVEADYRPVGPVQEGVHHTSK